MSYTRRPKRFKVVVRNLPPDMEEEKFKTSFLAPMKEGLAKDASFIYYVGGEQRKNDTPVGSRAYLMFSKLAAAEKFVAALQPPPAHGYRNLPSETVEAIGDQSKIPRLEQCTATISVYQTMSLSAPRREAKIQNTIEQDKDYIRFVEILAEQAAKKMPSAEKQLEDKIAAEDAQSNDLSEPRPTAALVRFLVQKKTARIKPKIKAAPKKVTRVKSSNKQRGSKPPQKAKQNSDRKDTAADKTADSGGKNRKNEGSQPKRIMRRDKGASGGGKAGNSGGGRDGGRGDRSGRGDRGGGGGRDGGRGDRGGRDGGRGDRGGRGGGRGDRGGDGGRGDRGGGGGRGSSGHGGRGGGGGGGGRGGGRRKKGGRDRSGRPGTIAPTMILSRALQSRGSGGAGAAKQPMRILRKPKDAGANARRTDNTGGGIGGGAGKKYVNFLS